MTLKLLIAGTTLFVGISVVSCTDKKYTKYQCPMKCEQEKTYDKAGDCPICGMELKGIE